jgi:hypothetical protein
LLKVTKLFIGCVEPKLVSLFSWTVLFHNDRLFIPQCYWSHEAFMKGKMYFPIPYTKIVSLTPDDKHWERILLYTQTGQEEWNKSWHLSIWLTWCEQHDLGVRWYLK